MRRRTHLRTRVLLLTGAFALALFAIAFGLSWRAKQSQERWTRLISIETKAVATLEELIRAQNAFYSRKEPMERYRLVEQLLTEPSLQSIDVRALRGRVKAFRELGTEYTSRAVVEEAQMIIAARKREIAAQLPQLERDTRSMMSTGLAIAWIVALLGLAVVQN